MFPSVRGDGFSEVANDCSLGLASAPDRGRLQKWYGLVLYGGAVKGYDV